MQSVRYFIAIFFMIAAATTSGQTVAADRDVDRLWQAFQAVESGETSRSGHDAGELFVEALRLQAAAEHGQITLDAHDWRRLRSIIVHGSGVQTSTRQSKSERNAEPMSSHTGTVSGTVSESGGPALDGGTVRAIPFGGDPFGGVVSGTIGSAGDYALTLDVGHWVLQTSGTPEHIPTAYPDIDCVDAKICSPWYGGEVIEVTGGSTQTRDITVNRGVRIEGHVQDGSANPVENARVALLSRNGQMRATATTDASGNYITNRALPAGEYRIFVEAPDGSGLIGQLHDGQDCQSECADLTVTFDNLTNTASPITYDFTLNDGFTLSGQVTESDGTTALEGALVKLVSTDGATSVGAETDAGGNYETPALRATDYKILVSHPQRLGLVHSGVECFDADCVPEVGATESLGGSSQTLDFSLNEGASVSGTIVRASDSNPVSDALVRVYNDQQGSRSVETDGAGDFTVSGLAEGTFYVLARPPTGSALQKAFLGNVNCPANNACGEFGEPISVPDGGTVGGLTIELEEGGGIEGSVTDTLTGAPLSAYMATRLELWVASGPFKGELAAQPFPDSTGGGDYIVEGLKPGAYKATFGTSTHLGVIDTAYGGQPCPRGSCDLDALPTVFVTAGATLSGIDGDLGRGPVISGRVTDSDTGEAPPPLVHNPTSRIISFYSTSGQYASFDVPDDDGHYRSRTGFPVDTFYAATYSTRNEFSFGDNYVDEVHDDVDCPRLKCNLTGAASGLNVTSSDIANIDFSLRQGGSISGAVTDDDGGAAIAGVGIEVYNGAGELVATGTSDALGNYTVDALPTGSYSVRTRNSQGYVDELHDSEDCAVFCDPVDGTDVSVTEGSDTGGVDFSLVRSVGISGTVSVDGTAEGNITVEVYGAIGNFITDTDSASDGSFEVTGLLPGEFYLRTRNAFGYADVLYNANPCVGQACRIRHGDLITLSAGSQVSGITLDLESGASISGEVHDRDNTATKLSGVTVELLDDRGAVAFEDTTGGSGQFSFDGLAAGDYHLVTRGTPGYIDQTLGGTPCPSACNGLNGTPVNVIAGGSATGNDLDLAQGAEISGNVTAGGSPAVGAQASVYNDTGVPVEQVPTNASGNYEVDTLPDGDFFVRVGHVSGFVSELYDDIVCVGYCDIVNGDAVNISGGGSVGSIDFVLATGGAIAGTVTDSSSGSALSGLEVVAYDSSGEVAGSGLTDGSGAYSIGALPDGNYRVRTANTSGYVDEVHGGDTCSPSACSISSGSVVSVSGSTAGGIDFSLDEGSSISGSATDTFGNPLTSGTATLFDGNGFEVTTSSIADGLWSFDGLADGTYYVLIENNLGLVDELYDGVSCPAGACDITGLGTAIAIGGTAEAPAGARSSAVNGLDIELDRGRAVTGTVTDAVSGEPLMDVTVYVFDASGNLASFGTTDGRGEYVTGGGLPEGTYYAATASGSERGAGQSYVNELYDDSPCLLDCDPTQGTDFTVGASGASAIDFELESGAGVRGKVTGPEGENLVQVDVLIYDADGFLSGQTRTDSLGEYEIDGLPAGDYHAHTLNDLALADVTYGDSPCDGACDPADSDPITIAGSEFVENVDFVLGILDEVFLDRFQQ